MADDASFVEGYGEGAAGSHIGAIKVKSCVDLLKQKYHQPEDIAIQADLILKQMRPRVNRGKINVQKMFHCTYNAYRELGRNVDPYELGSKYFGLTAGEVTQTESLFSPLQTGYYPPNINVTCTEYIPGYCRSLNLSTEISNSITEFSNRMLLKDPSLLQEQPKTVAAGLFKYYLVIHGITLNDNEQFLKITGRSNATIENIYNRISILDNR